MCRYGKGEAEGGVGGSVGKKSQLTQQVLGFSRLPVSHPQTRPNQSTGPHAAKHMVHQTGIHRVEDPPHHTAQTYRDTRLDKRSQEHTAAHTHMVTHQETQTHRGTVGMQATRSTKEHIGTTAHMCTYLQHTPIQLTANKQALSP